MLKRPSLSRLPATAIGVTHITPARSWTLTVLFLISITVPLILLVLGPERTKIARVVQTLTAKVKTAWLAPETNRWLNANREILAGFSELETALEDNSWLARMGRPPLQEALLAIGAGNEQVYPGREGWLFYRPEFNYLTARRWAHSPLTPEKAIADFAADLAERNIALILVPTPGKPLIHPEKFIGRPMTEPPQNHAWESFLSKLQEASRREFQSRNLNAPLPQVFDPTPLLWQRKASGNQYLRTDSHWNPSAMKAVADAVAGLARPTLSPPDGPLKFTVVPAQISGKGDTAHMLRLPTASRWNDTEDVSIERIVLENGEPWKSDDKASVLLLGDSFSNIYSQEALGWGEGAGFAEQLSRALGFAIDSITRNDSGASSTRELLQTELAKDPSRLEGKKVVIWQFAMRELSEGSWKETDLPAGLSSPAPSAFLVLGPGETRILQGTIQSMGQLPQVGQTPYKDYLTAFHLSGLSHPGGSEAVVYLQTMTDNELTPAARLAPGQKIEVELHSWADVEDRYGSLNRGDLDDFELQLQEPNFGNLHP